MRKYNGPVPVHMLDDYWGIVRSNYSAMLRTIADELENSILPIPYCIIPVFVPSPTDDKGDFFLYVAEQESEVYPLIRVVTR